MIADMGLPEQLPRVGRVGLGERHLGEVLVHELGERGWVGFACGTKRGQRLGGACSVRFGGEGGGRENKEYTQGGQAGTHDKDSGDDTLVP